MVLELMFSLLQEEKADVAFMPYLLTYWSESEKFVGMKLFLRSLFCYGVEFDLDQKFIDESSLLLLPQKCKDESRKL